MDGKDYTRLTLNREELLRLWNESSNAIKPARRSETTLQIRYDERFFSPYAVNVSQ